MTDLTPIILTRSLKATYRLMPEFLDRVRAFDDDDWTVNIANAFEAAFCAESPIMLGIALMDGQGVMRGHCIAAIETFAGKSQAFVHQLAKDKGFDHSAEETTAEVNAAVEAWAVMASNRLGTQVTHVIFSVVDAARERLFMRQGYEKGPRLMRKELGNVMATRGRVLRNIS